MCGEKSPLCEQLLQMILSNCYEDEHGTFRNVKKRVNCLVWKKKYCIHVIVITLFTCEGKDL